MLLLRALFQNIKVGYYFWWSYQSQKNKKSTHFVFEQIQTVYFIRECKSTLSELKYSPGDTTKVFESLGMGTHVWKALILLLLQIDLYVCLPHATFSAEDKKISAT